MESLKRKELSRAFSDVQQIFICGVCYCAIHVEKNRPLIGQKCSPSLKKVCDECINQLKHDQRNAENLICKLC
jgi:hypothetical protein